MDDRTVARRLTMYRMQTAASLIATLIAVTAVTGPTFAAATLDRVRQSGKIALGYQADAQPFSYRADAGNPPVYSVALCKAVADHYGPRFCEDPLRVRTNG